MEFTIQPTLVPKYAVRMTINVNVLLAKKAFVQVSFFEEDSEFTPLDTKVIMIEGQEYFAWGNDDNYIKDLVFSKLGLSKEIIKS